jgi:hypothetical protein
MTELLQALADFGQPLRDLFFAVVNLLLPWLPLFLWIVFFTFGVNWQKLRPLIWSKMGIVGLFLIGFTAVMVWGTISPGDGKVQVYNLQVGNYVEKTIYVAALATILFLCGATQLSGFWGQWGEFPAIELPDSADSGHQDHGQGGHDHDGHGHDGHGGHGEQGHSPAPAHH